MHCSWQAMTGDTAGWGEGGDYNARKDGTRRAKRRGWGHEEIEVDQISACTTDARDSTRTGEARCGVANTTAVSRSIGNECPFGEKPPWMANQRRQAD
jgi:hypothetical protein